MRGMLPSTLFYSTKQAATYLGIGVPMFLAYVKEHSAWMRPVLHGKGERKTARWHRDDLRCLAHILSRIVQE